MSQRLETACLILRGAISEKKSLKWACDKCGVNESYIRKANAECKGQPGHDEFLKLYNQFKSGATAADVVDLPQNKQKNSVKFDENSGELDARGNAHVKTLDSIIKEAKIDTRIWEVERHVINKWDVTLKAGREKIPQTFQNWQVKVWLKKRVEIEEAIKFEDFFTALLKKHKPIAYPKLKYPKNNSNNLLEIQIPDLHIGKLCWSEEVENNYDTKIASARFKYALGDLLKKAESSQYERILFPVGNDFFNSDTHVNTTTAGTRVDEDSRWQKTFRTGMKLLVDGIDYMRQFAPVDVLTIPGNHDVVKNFMLGEALHAWYRNDKSVNIDNRANPRKYYEYGKVLLGFTHGNLEKIEKLRSLMAFESKEAWARTIYKEFHIGHQHRKLGVKHIVKSDILHEELGIVVRSMSSLSGTDAWHHGQGYVGPIRAAEAYLWNKETGLEGSFNSNIRLGDDK